MSAIYGSDSNSGECWDEAYESLTHALAQLALDPAITTILIAQGTYTPSSLSGFSVQNSCLIKGGFAGSGTDPGQWNPDLFVTTLSGDFNDDDDGSTASLADNADHVMVIEFTAETVTIEGLTIKGGNALPGSATNPIGGGIWARNGSLIVLGCAFVGNMASEGGAIYSIPSCAVELRRSVFLENGIPTDSLTTPGSGGAIFSQGDLMIVRCRFEGNRVGEGGQGGAICAPKESTPFRVTNCIFLDNHAGREGASGGANGGAIFTRRSMLEITGCLLAGNRVTGGTSADGGAISTADYVAGFVTLNDCTIADNESTGTGGGVSCRNLVAYNTIAWGNTAASGTTFQKQLHSPNSVWTIEHSCVQGLNLGAFPTGNINTDPQFRTGEYRLEPGSPAVNAGENTLLPDDVTDVDEDTVTTGEALPLALTAIDEERARVVHCHVDMGAYEFGTATCVADLNEDGVVDGNDMGTLLGQWGTCPRCTADFNCDGMVDGNDLGELLGQWGTCPPGESSMMSGGGGGGVTPQAAAEESGFESVEEFVDWLSGLDFQTMSALLEGLFGD